MMSLDKESLDQCDSVTNLLIPDSSSYSGSSHSWDKTDFNSFRPRKPTTRDEDNLSSISGSSSSSRGIRESSGGFQVDLLSSEPEDFDDSDHLFHMDIIKNSMSDISLPTSRKVVLGKPKGTQNMSFSRERVREIERHNQLLLQKIMTTKPTLKISPKNNDMAISSPVTNNSRITSAAVNRKKKQRQIDLDNQLLMKKLEKIERSRRSMW
ncbi:cilia- and flagella-associated protein 97-like [Malaya genurostris]|uniref:cilia- and flagella-associated protein 97-like n=1 Tax=Malaya genurostris TaxID=325434 RepID=UPI0026F3E5FB|nr:cilia- and flagella-associated protein 97-like [Malaya genurostris]